MCVANCDQPLPNPPPKPPSNPPPSYPPPDAGGPGIGGCSVLTQRLKEKTFGQIRPILQCYFKSSEDYETLGRYLHPVQDFWAHSNAVFVTTCIKIVGWIDKECAEYEVVSYYTLHRIPDSLFHLYYLTSGLYGGSKGGHSWSASDDISCQKAISFIGSLWPPCDRQAKVFTHCMLNKDDNVGPDRDCMDACDQGDWPGDCGGDDNVQRYAFWDARNRALTSTVHYLFSFCREAPNLCY